MTLSLIFFIVMYLFVLRIFFVGSQMLWIIKVIALLVKIDRLKGVDRNRWAEYNKVDQNKIYWMFWTNPVDFYKECLSDNV